jgi:cysteine-rich secretory family protein
MTVLAVAAVLLSLFVSAPAQAAASGTQDWLNRINGLRAAHGLNALALDANLSDLAQQRAQINASTGTLVHTPNLAVGVTANWSKLAENIGAGQDHDGLWNAFLNSPTHLANLLDPSFQYVGIGEVITGPTGDWVTHRFMRVMPTSSSPAPSATPSSNAAPVYVQPTSPSRSTNHTSGGGSNGGGSRSGSNGGRDASTSHSGGGAIATSTDGLAQDDGGSADGAEDEGTSTRSPEHVAAVVNVLQALEK